MAILPTEFARVTRQSANWGVAKKRVLSAYREWIRSAPQIQTMYSIPLPVATVRSRIRQEFEKHRFVNQLPVVDVLLFHSNADYQETMNFWRQAPHIMQYFNEETLRGEKKLPQSFMQSFLEGRN